MYVIETHWTKIGLKLKLKSDWKGKEENFEFYSAYLEYKNLLLKNDKLNGEIKLKTENVQSNPSLRLKRIS